MENHDFDHGILDDVQHRPWPMPDEPWIQPVVLEGRIVRLEPLRHDHLDGLAENALADYFISVAPAPWSKDEVIAAYRQGLAVGNAR